MTQSGFDQITPFTTLGDHNSNDSLVNLQAGSGNTLYITQQGSNNTNSSFARSFGNNNYMSVTQEGTSNRIPPLR